jgi:hypothetical protein
VHEAIKAQNDKFTETAQAARHSEQWCRQKGIRKHMSLEEGARMFEVWREVG